MTEFRKILVNYMCTFLYLVTWFSWLILLELRLLLVWFIRRHHLLHVICQYSCMLNCFEISSYIFRNCTIKSKINGTPKGVYLPISKLLSILAVANSLAHNNITVRYYVQINSLWPKSTVASRWASKHFRGIPFILLLMVPLQIFEFLLN